MRGRTGARKRIDAPRRKQVMEVVQEVLRQVLRQKEPGHWSPPDVFVPSPRPARQLFPRHSSLPPVFCLRDEALLNKWHPSSIGNQTSWWIRARLSRVSLCVRKVLQRVAFDARVTVRYEVLVLSASGGQRPALYAGVLGTWTLLLLICCCWHAGAAALASRQQAGERVAACWSATLLLSAHAGHPPLPCCSASWRRGAHRHGLTRAARVHL